MFPPHPPTGVGPQLPPAYGCENTFSPSIPVGGWGEQNMFYVFVFRSFYSQIENEIEIESEIEDENENEIENEIEM